MGLTDATSMSYDFETQAAEVVYPEGSKVRITELTAYFDEASDGRVQLIKVTSGKQRFTLARDELGGWTTIDGA
jgi:hypothetical protein